MRRAGSLAILALLGACAGDRSAGGGGIETNNTVGIRVVDSTGAPVASARVSVRPADWTAGDPSSPAPGQILTTDDSGRVSGSLPAGRWSFEARKGGFAVLATREIGGAVELGSLELAPVARLSGNVALAAGESSVQVAVAGTDHVARTGSDGRWVLDSLPAGALAVVVSGRGVVDSVVLVAGTRDSLPWTGSPSLRDLDSAGWILLDDFTAPRPSISRAGPAAVWYMATDRVNGGRSVFRRRDGAIDSVWSRFLVAGESSSPASFQALFDLDSTAPTSGGAYLQVGMSLPEPGQCLDLGTLDSLRVTMQANGPVRVELRSDIHDSLQDFSSYPGVDLRPVDTGWTTFRVPAKDMVPRDDAAHPDIPWSRVAGCVMELRIIADAEIRIGLSDLRLHGVSLERFLKGRDR